MDESTKSEEPEPLRLIGGSNQRQIVWHVSESTSQEETTKPFPVLVSIVALISLILILGMVLLVVMSLLWLGNSLIEWTPQDRISSLESCYRNVGFAPGVSK